MRSIGVQCGAQEEFFVIIPEGAIWPIRESLQIPCTSSCSDFWVVAGGEYRNKPPHLLGSLDVSGHLDAVNDTMHLHIEVHCSEEPLIEVIVSIEGKSNIELAKVLTCKPERLLEPFEIARNADIVDVHAMDVAKNDEVFVEEDIPLAGDPKGAKKSVAEHKRHSVEESTQPDMEVPAELLEVGEQMSLPAANTAPKRPVIEMGGAFVSKESAEASRSSGAHPAVSRPEQSGASWTSQVIEGSGLELQLDEEVEPLGEGDGATRVISMSDLGLLKTGKGKQRPMATIAQMDPLGTMNTEASIRATSMGELSDNFEISESDILEEDFLAAADFAHSQELADFEEDMTIAPGQVMFSDVVDLDATIAPSSGVRPPVVVQQMHKGRHFDSMHDIEPEEKTVLAVGGLQGLLDAEEDSRLSGQTNTIPTRSLYEDTPPPDSRAQTMRQDPHSVDALHTVSHVDELRMASREEVTRESSLEHLASAMKQKQAKSRTNRLGVVEEPHTSLEKKTPSPTGPEEPEEAFLEEEHTPPRAAERVRNIAEKARMRVQERERKEAEQKAVHIEGTHALEDALAKMEQARLLASEARQMIEDAGVVAGGLDALLDHHSALLYEEEEGTAPLEASTRREARKVLDLGKRIAEVESNRLPSSTRKTLLRLTKELDKQLQESNGGQSAKIALQLANRLFETIRRDLRPW